MNDLASAVQAWLSLIIWKTVDAPKYHKGFVTLPFLTVAFMCTAMVLRVVQKRQDREKERCVEPYSSNAHYLVLDEPNKKFRLTCLQAELRQQRHHQ